MAARKEREPGPGEQIASLSAALAGPALPRIVIARGDERWFREQAQELAVQAARRAEMEVEKHDARDPDFDARSLHEALRAAPMFAGARCVVVRNAKVLLEKVAGEDAPLTRALLAWLADTQAAGMVVLDAEGLRADHAVAKAAVAARGAVLALRRLWDSPAPWDPDPRKTELVQWVTGRAREKRVPLALDEALYLATATGNDLFQLDAALDRLAHRAGQSVRSLVPWSSGGTPFDLAEHLARGDVARSLAGIEALFRLGFADKGGEREMDRAALLVITLGALRGKLRGALAGARSLERGGSLEAAAAAAGVPSYQKARDEFAERVRSRSSAEWQAVLADLAELERRTRRGGTTDANDLAAFALRWRKQATKKGAAPRG